MAKKPRRIVIDTNILISYLIGGSFLQLDQLFSSNNKITLLFSEELINEFLEVSARPKLRKYFDPNDVIRFLNQIQNHAEMIPVKSNVEVCRDPKDNFLLTLCKDGRADFLVTGDEDLLILKKFKKTSILKFSDFLKKL